MRYYSHEKDKEQVVSTVFQIKGGNMQNYRIQINEVDQHLYEDFKKGLKENDVQSTGHQSELNEIKRILFEASLKEFNENPKKFLKKLRSRRCNG